VKDIVTLSPVSTSPTADAVVTVMESHVGAHVGLLHRADDEGAYRHLHMAWHFLLKNEDGLPADGF